ncbi:3577_t:CDS:2 [Dentiscutata erythropus]|uniref:3577_t:CDS:1 n=1 Tax=Dentiscutata erythropus TaxID=1348616 RepID=A0A9N9J165_9GLOM|nr:3577_t:CDS:2 [Dentiscutata erythropus]
MIIPASIGWILEVVFLEVKEHAGPYAFAAFGCQNPEATPEKEPQASKP